MASPALEIAQKTSDVSLQMWAALLVKGNESFKVLVSTSQSYNLVSDLQQMSGDLSGEAMSRLLVESTSKHIAKGSGDMII